MKARIQMLADEIAVLRAISDDGPRRATADRVVAVKADVIRSLRSLLPGIPSGHTDVRRQPGFGAEAAAVPILAAAAMAGRVGSA
jgi:hypothetical protein